MWIVVLIWDTDIETSVELFPEKENMISFLDSNCKSLKQYEVYKAEKKEVIIKHKIIDELHEFGIQFVAM